MLFRSEISDGGMSVDIGSEPYNLFTLFTEGGFRMLIERPVARMEGDGSEVFLHMVALAVWLGLNDKDLGK